MRKKNLTDNQQFDGSINHVNDPNVILMFSNAPIHEIEQMLIMYYRTDTDYNKNIRLSIKIG